MRLVPETSGWRGDRRPLCFDTSLDPHLPTLAGKPGWAGSSPGSPLGAAPVPMMPGVDVLGTPGWLAPTPLPVVDCPPGAGVMPAEPGFVVVVPTGGTPPMPGATWPPAAAP